MHETSVQEEITAPNCVSSVILVASYFKDV